jgi:AcrR family transcriptional regulator
LLETARRLFAERGSDVSLAAVAREAGVGVGTVYRHFPTQQALVEAAYRDEVTRLCDAAGVLAAERPPGEALAQWLHMSVDHMATKRGMSDALHAAASSGSDIAIDSRGRVVGALSMLLEAAQAAGAVRSDVDAEDVAATFAGVYPLLDQPARAHRVIDLVLDGLRSGADPG